MQEKAEQIIRLLDLKPHPEGGYFKETYRSLGEISTESLSDNFRGKRNYSTCIYFMLLSENFSAFHRINQDEIWHFYDGAPITLHEISPEGVHKKVHIGKDLQKGERPQYVVPAGHWFAAEVAAENQFSLVGCTVAPGFSFDDFELTSRQTLLAKFPQHEKIIKQFTRV